MGLLQLMSNAMVIGSPGLTRPLQVDWLLWVTQQVEPLYFIGLAPNVN